MPVSFKSPSIPCSFSSVITQASRLTPASEIPKKFRYVIDSKNVSPAAPSRSVFIWALTRNQNATSTKQTRSR